MGAQITVFRLSKAYKENTAKLRLAYSPETTKTALPETITAILNLPSVRAEKKSGDAPMDPRERKRRSPFSLDTKKGTSEFM